MASAPGIIHDHPSRAPRPAPRKSFPSPHRVGYHPIVLATASIPGPLRPAAPPDRSKSWDQLAYDAPGNIIAYPHLIDGKPAGTRIAVYDAWNRLVEIKHDNHGDQKRGHSTFIKKLNVPFFIFSSPLFSIAYDGTPWR